MYTQNSFANFQYRQVVPRTANNVIILLLFPPITHFKQDDNELCSLTPHSTTLSRQRNQKFWQYFVFYIWMWPIFNPAVLDAFFVFFLLKKLVKFWFFGLEILINLDWGTFNLKILNSLIFWRFCAVFVDLPFCTILVCTDALVDRRVCTGTFCVECVTFFEDTVWNSNIYHPAASCLSLNSIF